jgi:hypothetical protein
MNEKGQIIAIRLATEIGELMLRKYPRCPSAGEVLVLTERAINDVQNLMSGTVGNRKTNCNQIQRETIKNNHQNKPL